MTAVVRCLLAVTIVSAWGCSNNAGAPIRVKGLPPGIAGALSVRTPPSLRGGSRHEVSFTTVSGFGIERQVLEYSPDGITFTAISDLSADATSTAWTTPLDDTSLATLRVSVEVLDKKSNKLYVADAKSTPFVIDSTGPQPLAWRLQSPAVTSQPSATFIVDSCLDAVAVFIGSSSTAPDLADPAWLPCPVSATDRPLQTLGSITFNAWSRDELGNMTQAAPLSLQFISQISAIPQITLQTLNPTSEPDAEFAVEDCDGLAQIAFAEGSDQPGDAEFVPCAPLPFVYTRSLTEGPHAIVAYGSDEFGNRSAASNVINVTADFTPPVVTISPLAVQAVQSSTPVTLSYTATDALLSIARIVVEASYDNGATYSTLRDSAEQSPFVWPGVVAPPSEALLTRFRVSAFDSVGNNSVVNLGPLVVTDVRPPSPTVFTLNGLTGNPVVERTANPTANANLTVPDDDNTVITHVCFKRVPWPGTPAVLQGPDDPCFKRVDRPPYDLTLAAGLDFNNAPVPLGFLRQTLRVFAWVKNAAGLTSVMTDPGPSAGREGTDGADAVTINYDPGEPPVVINVVAANSDVTQTDLPPTEFEVSENDDVYIKWNVTFPTVLTVSNGPGPLSLWYTDDDVNYTLIADQLAPTSTTNGCSATGPFNGCYRWPNGAPYSSFFRVQVRASDGKGLTTVASATPPMNTGAWLRFIVGNTEGGIGGSSLGVPLSHALTSPLSEFITQSLAVSSRGTVYFVNRTVSNEFQTLNGNILWINPASGNIDVLVARNGENSLSQRDGCVINAPAECLDPETAIIGSVAAIAVDYDDNLIFRDGYTLRKIETLADGTPVRVVTLVGQGPTPSAYAVQGAEPQNVALEYCNAGCALVPLPNGDILIQQARFARGDGSFYGTPDNFFGIRRYVAAATPYVDVLMPTGDVPLGPNADPVDLSECALSQTGFAFDPETSAIETAMISVFDGVFYSHPECQSLSWVWTNGGLQGKTEELKWLDAHPYASAQPFTGMDGHLYVIDAYANQAIYRRDSANTWTKVVGAATLDLPQPYCEDGMAVSSSCAVAAQDAFVDVFGRLFFTQLGSVYTVETNGTPDTADDLVKRVAGRALDAGNGGHPLSARLPGVSVFDQWIDGANRLHVAFSDLLSRKLRQARENDTVVHLAGSGQIGETQAGNALGQPMAFDAFSSSFMVDQATNPGDVYYILYNKVLRLAQGASDWEQVIGGEPGTVDYLAEAATGTNGLSLSFGDDNPPRGSYLQYPFDIRDDRLYMANYVVSDQTMVGCFEDSLLYSFGINDDYSIRRFSGNTGVTNSCQYDDPLTVGVAALDEPYQYFCGNYAADSSLNPNLPATYNNDTPVASCHLALHSGWSRNRAGHDDLNSRFVVIPGIARSSNRVYTMGHQADGAPAGNVQKLTQLQYPAGSYSYRRHASGEYIYYCPFGTTASEVGRLRRRHVDTNTEVALPWPVAQMVCTGESMYFNSTRNSVTFGYQLGNQFGIAEYVDDDPTSTPGL